MGKSFSKLTPRIVNTLFLVALQKYFTGHKEYPGDDDPDMQYPLGIEILTDFPEDLRKKAQFPALVIQGTDVTFNQDGIGNMQHLHPYKEVNLEGKEITKAAFIEEWLQFTLNSAVQIHCIAESRDACDELAFEVAVFMVGVKHQIGDILQIQYTSMPHQSAPQLMSRDGWRGAYDSVVTIPYVFTLRRLHSPVDLGPVLNSVETILDPVHKPGDPLPGEGDKDHNGDDINIGGTGGTGTGGENGNWGGSGGITDGDPTADGIDDGWITLRFRVRSDTVDGQQILPGDIIDPSW